MRGQILQAEPAGGGVIAGSDGNRYTFMRSDWKGPSDPVTGTEVDFIAGTGTAAEIFPLRGRVGLGGATASSFATGSATTALRGPQPEGSSVVLGIIGIVCLVLSFIIPLLPLIAALILGLIGASSAKRYHNDTGLVLSRTSWIGAVALFVVGVLLLIVAVFFAWPLVNLIWLYILDEMAKAGTTTAMFAL